LKLRHLFVLLLLTFGALLVHGYHPFAEDAEIYLPGVERILHPQLFPFNAQFFESHARLTLFPNLIATSVRWSHLPLETVVFLWQLISIFLFLLAGWQLSGKCFTDRKARWAGVALIAALLTLPVAGTELYILDQYINPRNLTAFAAVFAVVKTLDQKYVQAGLFLLFSAAIHPLMTVFVLSYCLLLAGLKRFGWQRASFACILPLGISLQPPSEAYHQLAAAHPAHYLTRWHWYEWLGVLAPVLILWCFDRVARSQQRHDLSLMCWTLVVYELVYVAAALLLSLPARLEGLAWVQPMRSLYLVYILMFLFGGGFLGEYVLKNRIWRWFVLFVPLCAGMFLAQHALFPASAHIEWPGAAPRNPWVQAFLWIRNNTAEDALFALDPFHMEIPGEDENGFRAIAQRSRLADAVKDGGAVTMFPPMAEEWLKQVQAQRGWREFQLQDFGRLREKYGVTWVVLQQPFRTSLQCPYQNATARVCRLN